MRSYCGMVGLGVLALSLAITMQAKAQGTTSADAPAVLVELFTSEGCSSCPPADELLREVNRQKSSQGQLIIGLSEHVTYWNQLGWKDPFSAEEFTVRQNEYSHRFHTEGPYTPQMVVNGREQFVGSDRAGLRAALKQESTRQQARLSLSEVKVEGDRLSFGYSVQGVAAGKALLVMAAVVDDSDQSSVQRGENAGRSLEHVFVVRTLVQVVSVSRDEAKTGSLPYSMGTQKSVQAHHLVLFLQESGLGSVEAVDAKTF